MKRPVTPRLEGLESRCCPTATGLANGPIAVLCIDQFPIREDTAILTTPGGSTMQLPTQAANALCGSGRPV